MNIWLIVAIVVAVGMVIGNILLLKQSAKLEFKKPETPAKSLDGTDKKATAASYDDDDDDDKSSFV